MGRLVITLKLPQKKSLHASEQDTKRVQQARAKYQEAVAPLNPQRMKFIDESGVNLAMTRLYGRAPGANALSGPSPSIMGRM